MLCPHETLVQIPDRRIEDRRVRDPEHVGQEEICGAPVDGDSAEAEKHDAPQQDDDIDKREENRVEAEEENRPRSVEKQVREEERHPSDSFFRAGVGAPHQCERAGHAAVEDKPHRRKEPCGRVEERLCDAVVPGERCCRDEEAADKTGSVTREDRDPRPHV